MRIHEVCEAANKGGRDDMQDVMTIARTRDGADYLGIFDGFGDYGQLAAEWSSNCLQTTAKKSIGDLSAEQHAKVIQNAFLELNKTILKRKIDKTHSTATVAILKNDDLAVAYLGDSEASYYEQGGVARRLIKPHNGRNDSELQRIEETDTEEEYEKMRGSFLLTRAIGVDAHHVLAKAEVKVIRSIPTGVLLLATDGVWGKTDASHAAVDGAVMAAGTDLSGLVLGLVEPANRISIDNAAVIAARIE